MKNMNLFMIIFFFLCISCNEGKRIETNLKGEIKQIITNKKSIKINFGLMKIEKKINKTINLSRQVIDFNDNKIFNITHFRRTSLKSLDLCAEDRYHFFYNGDFLDYIYRTSYYKCNMSFYRKMPNTKFDRIFNYNNYDFIYSRDSIITNKLKDPTEIYFLNKENEIIKTHKLEYKYDSLNNWIEKIIYEKGYLIEESKREIKYKTTHNKELS